MTRESKYEAEFLDTYNDDPIEDPPQQSKFKSSVILLVAIALSFFGMKGILAANIGLGSSSAEFGQGLLLSVSCSGNNTISFRPESTFTNARGGGAFYFSGFTVSGVPSGCNGKQLSFNAYSDTSTAPLAIYSSSSTTVDISVSNSSFSSSNSGLTVSTNSSSGFSVTFTNPVALATSAVKYTVQSSLSPVFENAGSIDFTSNDSLSFTSVASVGTGAFTIEGWFNFTSAPTANALIAAGGSSQGLYLNSAMNQINIDVWGPGTGDQAFYFSALSPGVWYHIAVVRDSSKKTQLFINGTKSTNAAITDNNNYTGGIGYLFASGAGGKNIGKLSNFRVTNTAIYDPNASSITKPTSPLTAVSGTLLLLNTKTTDPFADSSGNNRTVTRNGSPSSSSSNPFS